MFRKVLRERMCVRLVGMCRSRRTLYLVWTTEFQLWLQLWVWKGWSCYPRNIVWCICLLFQNTSNVYIKKKTTYSFDSFPSLYFSFLFIDFLTLQLIESGKWYVQDYKPNCVCSRLYVLDRICTMLFYSFLIWLVIKGVGFVMNAFDSTAPQSFKISTPSSW